MIQVVFIVIFGIAYLMAAVLDDYFWPGSHTGTRFLFFLTGITVACLRARIEDVIREHKDKNHNL